MSDIVINLVSDVSISRKGNALDKRKVVFTIDGVDNSIAGALRRTLMMELKVSSLACEYGSIETTNEEIIRDMIVKRVALIPIDQSCPSDAVFSLDVTNNTPATSFVRTRDIVIKRKGGQDGKPLTRLPFEPAHVVCALLKQRSISINEITIKRDYGYNFAGHVVAVLGTAVFTTDNIINAYSNQQGAHISNTNNLSWRVSFQTNGTMDSKMVMSETCKSLIFRLKAITEYSDQARKQDNTSKLTIQGETDTIGNMLMRAILQIQPNIPAVTYLANYTNRTCVLSVRTHDDLDVPALINQAIENRVRVITTILKSFS